MRKGQYIAIESVLSIGLSIIVAIAGISFFNQYRTGVMDTLAERQVQEIESELSNMVYNLEQADSGSQIETELPESLGSEDYRLDFVDQRLEIITNTVTYQTNLAGFTEANDVIGSSEGNEVTLLKTEDEYVLAGN